MSPEARPGVLIVGAGPTGLSLAAQVRAFGADLRIVERRSDLVRESRAMVIHPRTLEMLRSLGVAQTLVERGNPNAAFQVHFDDAAVVAGRLAGLGLEDTAYPFLLVITQAETEAVLSRHLDEVGVPVERGVELVSLEHDGSELVVTLAHTNGRLERMRPRYLVGCDGVGSAVRRHAAIPFGGSNYPYPLVLADVEVLGGLAPDTAHAFVAGPGILFFFPVGGPATWRMLAARPAWCEGSESLEQLQEIADVFTGGSVHLQESVWRTELWLERRLAARYSDGRIFLAGDAAHVHSPAAAQGMNAGVRDACNLGWKIALVSRGLAPESLLDSYEAEHRPVARMLRAMTDVAFAVETADHPALELVRTRLAPVLMPLGLRSQRAVAALARTVAGLRLRYRGSPAIQKRRLPRLGLAPGDRLPDAPVLRDGQPASLHGALTAPAFHLVLGGRGVGPVVDRAEVLAARYAGLVKVHRLARTERSGALYDPDGTAHARLGVRRFGYLLIRPDGHIAARGEDSSLDAARTYLATWLPTVSRSEATGRSARHRP